MDLYQIRKYLNQGQSIYDLPLKVTFYARVSTDHFEQLNSLSNQAEYFKELIMGNKNWEYVPGYIDEGITGTSALKRENFMAMIDDADRHLFDLIITKEISRFSRNTLDSIQYTRNLLEKGVAIFFVNDNINTALPDSELRLTIMASLAQDEIRKLSERVKFGMKRAIKNGHILGNDMLYGYKKIPGTNTLKIIPEEARIVERIFYEYAVLKQSLRHIAQKLNADHIRTAQNRTWQATTISRMISNIKYKGYYCGKKTEIVDYMTKKMQKLPISEWVLYADNEHIPPIIDEDLWDKANARLIEGQKPKSLPKKVGPYPLSNKLICQEDKALFHRRQQRRNKRDVTWVCSNVLNNGRQGNHCSNIRESEIMAIVEDILKELHFDLKKVVKILKSKYDRIIEEADDEMAINIQREITKIALKKEKILELNIEGHLDNNEFAKLNQQYNKELEHLNQQVLKDRHPHPISERQIEKYVNYPYLENLILNNLLDHIEVCQKDMEISLTIFFNLNLMPLNKHYTFKRGYDTKATKRYQVNYFVLVQGN